MGTQVEYSNLCGYTSKEALHCAHTPTRIMGESCDDHLGEEF